MAQFIKSGSPFFQTTLLVAAAGNENRDENADFEIRISPPAVSDGFVSVAALGEVTGGHFKIASLSNIGAMSSGSLAEKLRNSGV